MPFICLKRTDIPNSTLQVTDLWPNKSQFNPSVDPPAVGPRYISAPVTNHVSLSGTFQFMLSYTGLAAYLLANIQATGAGGPAMTSLQADTAASLLITAMHAGSPLTAANVNATLVAAAGAGTALTAGLSTGVLTDILRIMSGVTYTVPVGTTIQAVGVFTPQASAATWNANNFAAVPDILATDSSFYDSLYYGKIAGFKKTTFMYKGVTGAALTVYDNAGGVF